MKDYDVQSIKLNVPRDEAITYIADAINLPEWTSAFAAVTGKQALMRTPNGEVEIGLDVYSSEEDGAIDWRMAFPDGSVAVAYSRVVALSSDSCVYCFVLTPPPVPLEQLEGALVAQSRTLVHELVKLKQILEDDR